MSVMVRGSGLSRTGAALAAVIAGLLVGSPAAASPAVPAPPPEEAQLTGRAVVLVEPAESPQRVRQRLSGVLDGEGLRSEVAVPQLGAAAVEIPVGSSVAALRRELFAEPGVVRVTPEYRRSPRLAPLTPDDPAWATLDPAAPAGDLFQWNLVRERFPGAWARSQGTGVEVAVIDTGIDAYHPELAPRIVEAIDADGSLGSGPATVDETGHGTHVAGLACAASNNGYAGASAGFGCGLIVEKTDFSDLSIASAIVDAADRGAEVINMSFGGPTSSPVIRDAIDYAWAHDVVMVAAASNQPVSNQGIPAEYLQPTGSAPDINAGEGLVVTAAEYDDTPASFDPGFGPGISLAAYGAASAANRGIFSTFPGYPTELEAGVPGQFGPCSCRTYFGEDDRFAYLRGTSMATPQVAGAAALIRSAKPAMSAARVIEILKRSARPGTFGDALGWGILDAKAALKMALAKKKKKKKGKREGAAR
jgi:subtilisin family serine protease